MVICDSIETALGCPKGLETCWRRHVEPYAFNHLLSVQRFITASYAGPHNISTRLPQSQRTGLRTAAGPRLAILTDFSTKPQNLEGRWPFGNLPNGRLRMAPFGFD